MGSTNFTPNLHLPQFIATDKPSWLGDWNDAMKAIDDSAGDQHVTNNKVTASFAAVNLRIDGDETRITALENKGDTTDTDITKIQTDITVLQQNYETIHHEVVTNSNNITEQGETIADHETRITALEGEIANVGKLETDVDNLSKAVADNETNVDNLTTSVTKAESDIVTLTTSVTKAESDIATLTTSVSKCTASIAEAQLEIVQAQDDIAHLDTLTEAQGEDIEKAMAEINSIKPVTLWTNPDPTSAFAAQSVDISGEDIKFYEVIFILLAPYSNQVSSGKIEITAGTSVSNIRNVANGSPYSSAFHSFRSITNASHTSIAFGAGFTTIETGNWLENNSHLVPKQILGYK